MIRCVQVAKALQPGCAAGRPLRALSACNVDSKFFERNRSLLVALLDLRFDGMAGELGLESFLDALDQSDHWPLLALLAPGLLPFRQMRVCASELCALPEPASQIVIVENERCVYQLPPLADTVAILGAGLNLEWLQMPWLEKRQLAYWGDMDTWGLQMLARARCFQPGIHAVLMNRYSFDRHQAGRAVVEPVPADSVPPEDLTAVEKDFYLYLRERPQGRLEQEFLPTEAVAEELGRWRRMHSRAV